MNMWDRVFSRKREDEIAQFAEEIAEESYELVWQKIASRAGTLGSLPEARGYIRVRSRQVVRARLKNVIDRDLFLAAETETRIIERALVLMMGKFAGPMLAAEPIRIGSRRAA
jgi:hypothetical protein